MWRGRKKSGFCSWCFIFRVWDKCFTFITLFIYWQVNWASFSSINRKQSLKKKSPIQTLLNFVTSSSMDGVQKENLTEDCRSTKRSLMKTGSAFFGQWDQDKFVHPLVGVKHRGVSAAWVQKVLKGMTSTDDTRRDGRWSTILDDEMTRSLQNWVRKAWWRFKAQWKGGGEKRRENSGVF